MTERKSRYDLEAIGNDEYVPIGNFKFDKIHGALKPLDVMVEAIELRWGRGKLETLVSPETAAKFEAARAKMDVALLGGDPDEIVRRVSVMMRGWEALEKEAKERGHKPAPPELWYATAPEEYGDEELQIVIAKDIPAATLAPTDLPVYTVTEVARIVRAWRSQSDAHKIKALFKGAEVVRVYDNEIEEDEVPF